MLRNRNFHAYPPNINDGYASGAVTYFLEFRDVTIDTAISRHWSFTDDHIALFYIREIQLAGPVIETGVWPSRTRHNVWFATIRIYAENCGLNGRVTFDDF